MYNIEIGGKLGDFLYGLIVPKILYDLYFIKSNIYISNKGDSFETSLIDTYNSLYPIVMMQSYVNEFNIYNNNIKYDYELSNFRSSQYLYKTTFIELYLKEYFPYLSLDYIKNFTWMEVPIVDDYKNVILINRPSKHIRQREYFNIVYKNIIDRNENVKFICYDKCQYNSFMYKNFIECILCKNITDWYTIINSCELFVGGYSSPIVMASSVNKSRIAETAIGIDHIFLKNDIKYYDNISWIEDVNNKYISDKHLKYNLI